MYRLFDFIILAIFISIQILIYARITTYLQEHGAISIGSAGIVVKVEHLYYIYFVYSVLSIFLLDLHPYFFYVSTLFNIAFIALTFYVISRLPKNLDREFLFVIAIITTTIYTLLLTYYAITQLVHLEL